MRIDRTDWRNPLRTVLRNLLWLLVLVGLGFSYVGYSGHFQGEFAFYARMLGPTLVVAGLWLISRAKKTAEAYRELQQRGYIVPGEIMGHWVSGRVNNRPTAIGIQVVFTDSMGREQKGTEYVFDNAFVQGMQHKDALLGGGVHVRVHPSRAEVFQIVSFDATNGAHVALPPNLPSTARRVSFRRGHGVIPLIVGLIFLGATFLFVPPDLYFRRIKTAVSPSETTVGEAVHQKKTSKSINERKIYRVTYRFSSLGTDYENFDELILADLRRREKGSRGVQVTYVKGSPEVSVIRRRFPVVCSLFVLISGAAVFLGLGILMGRIGSSRSASGPS